MRAKIGEKFVGRRRIRPMPTRRRQRIRRRQNLGLGLNEELLSELKKEVNQPKYLGLNISSTKYPTYTNIISTQKNKLAPPIPLISKFTPYLNSSANAIPTKYPQNMTPLKVYYPINFCQYFYRFFFMSFILSIIRIIRPESKGRNIRSMVKL